MEEINLKSLFDFFISKLRIIIFVTLIVILIGAVYSLFIKTPMYEATTRLVLTGTTNVAGSNQNTVTQEGITQNDLNLNSKLVATYREIIKSKTVLKDVIAALDLDCTVKELESKISVSTVQDTEMISITVEDAEASKTASIANKLADIFSEQIKDIYNIENISIIDKAEVPLTPTNINIVKQVVIYTLIGLVLACAIVFLMFYFDTTLKDVEQVEKMGFTVLTSIPEKMDEGGKK